MNQLQGSISNIESSSNISIVDIDVMGCNFTSIIVGTPDNTEYLVLGNKILILFKETEVSLAKGLKGIISLRNQIDSIVKNIIWGSLLTQIELEFINISFTSVITTRSAKLMALKVGDNVTGLIKANEISLAKLLNE
jgi:molybdopterin-binding protein